MERCISVKLHNLLRTGKNCRLFSVSKSEAAGPSETRTENAKEKPKNDFVVKTKMTVPSTLREVFPDFMPNPIYCERNPITEKLERMDMMRRREVLDIPEFYVGSIMAVTQSDRYTPNRTNRFVGICIARDDTGLRHHFVLRNVIDGLGVEIRYNMYHPFILKIEVLKLEKRLDDELYYLRDALPEYSTIPFNFEPEPIKPNAPIPINPIKVKLKTGGKWSKRWEIRNDLKGIEDAWTTRPDDWWRLRYRSSGFEDRWKKYDILGQYQRTIPDRDQQKIFEELVDYNEELSKKSSRRRTFLAPLYRSKQKRLKSSTTNVTKQ